MELFVKFHIPLLLGFPFRCIFWWNQIVLDFIVTWEKYNLHWSGNKIRRVFKKTNEFSMLGRRQRSERQFHVDLNCDLLVLIFISSFSGFWCYCKEHSWVQTCRSSYSCVFYPKWHWRIHSLWRWPLIVMDFVRFLRKFGVVYFSST